MGTELLSRGDKIRAIQRRNFFYIWTDFSNYSNESISTLYNKLHPNPVTNPATGVAMRAKGNIKTRF